MAYPLLCETVMNMVNALGQYQFQRDVLPMNSIGQDFDTTTENHGRIPIAAPRKRSEKTSSSVRFSEILQSKLSPITDRGSVARK